MKLLLLDTEAFIWWDDNDPRLGGNARAAIRDAAEVYVSAASSWEIVIKRAIGKLSGPRSPAEAVLEGGFRELSISFEHTEGVGELPMYHKDPFDRLIIAAARVEGLTVVTSDPQFERYDVPLIDARR